MSLFRGKYRNESSRKPGYDYGNSGLYFITINSFRRINLFGRIIEGKMQFSEIGKIAEEEWLESFVIRKEMSCDEWILMPDHLHAIIKIEKELFDSENDKDIEIKKHGVAYRSPKSISSMVAGFKSAATIKINLLRKTPGRPVWQARFHDHIIRNTAEYERIKQYIKNNPNNYKG